MKHSFSVWMIFALAASAFAGVTVTSPSPGAKVGSPVNYAAKASSGCSKGVASVGIYVNNKLTFVENGSSVNTSLKLDPGNYNTVVEEWDNCGGASYASVPITVTQQTGVWVSSPANNSTVGAPVNYSATASTSSCAKGISTMGVYVDNKLTYVANGAKLNTTIAMSPGNHKTVVEEWDYCGGAYFTPVNVAVQGNVISNIQGSGGWVGYGEYPPKYDICTSCGDGVTFSMNQGVTSPSLSGNATKFNMGGTHAYADVLWTNPLIGQNTTQGKPDSGHKLLPTLHNFVYDGYFFGTNLGLSQALEFDINQYMNGQSFIWGTQCRIAGGNEWDIWDNVSAHWVSTGVACNPNNNAWNHVTITAQRTYDNWLYFQTITLNGKTATLNKYYPPGSVPSGWYGITVNFQTDGNSKQSPYSIYMDNFSFIYW
jgi:hypothetical protein